MDAQIPNGIIELEEMEFYAYHGCFREENVVGNRFIVNIALKTDMTLPMKSDKINDALNYMKVYKLVRQEMQQTSNLLENVTARIIDSLYRNFPQIKWTRVKVSKMNPPMGGQMKKVSVTLEKSFNAEMK
ncbi:MAG: 7,8-dihydroneopterin aldolase/epimerase/oxygenase [Anaerophaga sp.]|jgi:dihydroneopterin aldolase|uniref:dihydroneopterin aldolase n=1 Tax=Anaerophaga thermohalophila TaxID=177400 RepID=UPI000237BF04|nr:dihydroneopterin aldolase [Anaerophaga thermohalophila]MDN5290185.1 7,8-dihydroneopterin aldolase/epimerase/oxygenase [Anaerophaga sp.]